jgi:hypothetical protein
MTIKPHPAREPHATVQELAERWQVHNTTIVRWFRDEKEGVLRLSKPSKKGKRTRVELRISESAAERVYGERSRTLWP